MDSSAICERILHQEASVKTLLAQGNRGLERYSQLLQAIIANDVISITPKAVAVAEGIFYVTGNFQSVAEALDAGRYDVRWGLAQRPADIPLIVQPVDCRVRAVPLGQAVKTGELFELCPRLVDPMTLLTFGVKFPGEQCKALHFTVWLDAKGRFWYAILAIDGSRRAASVNWQDSCEEWKGDDCLLVRA